MSERDMEEWMARLRDNYNSPPETPREEMWAAIEKRLGAPIRPEAAEDVVPLRSRRGLVGVFSRPGLGWAATAAAILAIGLGIGRMTAPRASGGGAAVTQATAEPESWGSKVNPLRLAAMEHLARTESFLTLARADARTGQMEMGTGEWSRTLLTQTRLLLDAQDGTDPVMENLLEDLELILVQLVGATNADSADSNRTRTEMNLALDGLEESEVLPRIRSVLPTSPRVMGT